MNEDRAEKDTEEEKSKISRREFLKYGAGVAAIAVGATALMGKIPLPLQQAGQQKANPPANDSSEPIVATVSGDQVTVMNGQVIVKTKDSGLAALIAEKVNTGN